MAPRDYHAPPRPISTRPRCPVCNATVYSPAGIHPQCAVRQADPPRPKVKPPRDASQVAGPARAPKPTGAEVVVPPSSMASQSASD
jgi:hypothetical protein